MPFGHGVYNGCFEMNLYPTDVFHQKMTQIKIKVIKAYHSIKSCPASE